MATTLSVAQTTNAVLETYKKDIEAAAGDSVLSKAEQARLTPFAKKYIEAARVAGQKMTVTKAVAAVKAPLSRAINSVSGGDGMVDKAEVQNLRVNELRTRADSLFEAAGPSTALLEKSVKDMMVSTVTDWGYSAELRTFDKTKTVEDIVVAVSGIDLTNFDNDIGNYVKMVEGRAAVEASAKRFEQAGTDLQESADDPVQGADLRGRLFAVAAEVRTLFGSTEFERVIHAAHTIFEDGDLEVNMLLGKKKSDGTWVVLNHTHNPF